MVLGTWTHRHRHTQAQTHTDTDTGTDTHTHTLKLTCLTSGLASNMRGRSLVPTLRLIEVT